MRLLQVTKNEYELCLREVAEASAKTLAAQVLDVLENSGDTAAAVLLSKYATGEISINFTNLLSDSTKEWFNER